MTLKEAVLDPDIQKEALELGKSHIPSHIAQDAFQQVCLHALQTKTLTIFESPAKARNYVVRATRNRMRTLEMRMRRDVAPSEAHVTGEESVLNNALDPLPNPEERLEAFQMGKDVVDLSAEVRAVLATFPIAIQESFDVLMHTQKNSPITGGWGRALAAHYGWSLIKAHNHLCMLRTRYFPRLVHLFTGRIL